MPGRNDPLQPLTAEANKLSPLEQVEFWTKRQEDVAKQLERAVRAAKDDGASWDAIAKAAGMNTRQAAQNRFDKTSKERNQAGALKHYDEMRREAGLPPRKPRSK